MLKLANLFLKLLEKFRVKVGLLYLGTILNFL